MMGAPPPPMAGNPAMDQMMGPNMMGAQLGPPPGMQAPPQGNEHSVGGIPGLNPTMNGDTMLALIQHLLNRGR